MPRLNHSLLWQQSRSLAAILLLTLTCAVQTSIARQDATVSRTQADDDKLLNGLRDRQLFDLADNYCENLLASDDLPPQRRVSLAVHQLKNLTAKAVFSQAEDRAKIWKRVETIANDFSSTFPGSRRFLVRTQQSLATIAQTRLIRQEIDARLAQPDARSTAISLLRSVRDELDDTIHDINQAIPRATPKETPTDLSAPQLSALKASLQFQFAICNIERSQLYDAADKANRKDALSQALKKIATANRTTEKGKPLWWDAKLASSKCLRLLGRVEESDATLKTLPVNLMPTDLKPRFRIERLQVALASEDQKAVGTLVSQALENAQRTPPEDIALVQAMAWLARTSTPEKSVKWKALAASLVQTTKSSHGRYWGRRAELVLVDSIQQNSANNPAAVSISPDADLLILERAAETAVADKRYQNAADDFAKAILLAKRQSDYESVLRLSIRQARIFETLGQRAKAAQVMIDAAIVKPNLANAASAHLRGCWNLSQIISGPDANKQEVRLQKSLEDHLQTWPESPTAEVALLLLGDQYARSENHQAAFETFLRTPVSSPQCAQAIFKAGTSASNLLLSLEQSRQPLNIMTERLLGQLREPGTKNPALKPITELLAADIDVRYRSRLPDQDTIDELQQDPIAKGSLAELYLAIETISEIKDLNVFANKLSQAQNKRLTQQRLHEYLNAMRIRDDSSNSGETLAKANLMVAQQAAADAIRSNKRELATAWKLRIADLQQSLNQHQASIETLTDLVNEFPRKADLQIQLAQAMTEAYGKSDPEKPINQWRRLASKLRPESDNWFLAKYNVAKLLHSSGKRRDALKLLKYMQANPPGWDNSKLKSEFDSLFNKAQLADHGNSGWISPESRLL